ncbi:MAG: helix-turn-helix domain-containing protein [Candidatus Dormibacteraeota bacterium]|uniref:AraC family transcriptional regulator n=1 Tax=Candidatus Aeolococcus gillhamiae TaxID=3127015 RepID=A0A2W5Z3I0_9BACT|nr:helix-turn-helix domain-containing protein [Candidatus Dormibacteraeota bacterium]PZR77475.1 MAG: AraC family transcriptional regulator [Candidatus Dormibacter sp. RRmetagenome_bin12]
MLQKVVAAIGQRVAAFELGVLSEVFGLDRSDDGLPVYDFKVCAVEPPPLRSDAGFFVDTPYGLEELETADLIAIPAWKLGHEPPEELLEALRRAVARGGRVMSVCTGAFVLAASGLLDGKRATTHWRHAGELARLYPAIDVDPNVLYIDEGSVLTSAGTAAGIDLCLHILRKEHGATVANAVARRMVVPPHRDGGQAQYIEAPMVEHDRGDDLAVVLDWVQANLNKPFGVDHLARRANMSLRTFNRRFAATTGTAPHRWLINQRVQLAQRLLEETDLDVEQVAEQTGFGTAATLRQHFARQRGTSPQAYRRQFCEVTPSVRQSHGNVDASGDVAHQSCVPPSRASMVAATRLRGTR